jgi:hypothetical protein
MDELEELLRRFQPRRPRPLPELVRQRGPRWAVWAAASGLAAAAIIAAIVARDERAPAVETPRAARARLVITLGALNAQGLTSAEDLDGLLTRTSRAILPDVEQPGGVLQALSKE